jgi:hypothetical protein
MRPCISDFPYDDVADASLHQRSQLLGRMGEEKLWLETSEEASVPLLELCKTFITPKRITPTPPPTHPPHFLTSLPPALYLKERPEI